VGEAAINVGLKEGAAVGIALGEVVGDGVAIPVL